MRQLEQILGPDEMRDGLRDYLTRFAFGNATWTQLVEILDARTDQDLAAWSRVWVDEPGRPTIATALETRGGRITRLAFSQSDPRGRSLLWNQRLQVALGYEHGARITDLTLNGATVEVPRVDGLPLPRYVLPNGEGTGYGLFKLDDASRQFFLMQLPQIGDGLTRGTAWVTLWDDMLEGGTRPQQLFDLALAALPEEHEELNSERILAYTATSFWRYLSDRERAAAAPRLEEALRAGMTQASTTSLKSAYFNAFRRTVTTPDGLAYLERVWRRQEPVSGLTFAETDYIDMSQDLALRGVPNAGAILAEQHKSIANPDRKAQFAFVMPALSSDAGDRDAFFERLHRVENRRQERWVAQGLGFINHPLRRRHAERYLEPGLETLRDVQRTGDIFFPLNWTGALLDGHNSPAAAATVRSFLARQKDYPPRLRQVIEQQADQLFRAARILGS
jgi:aminopeptidase N